MGRRGRGKRGPDLFWYLPVCRYASGRDYFDTYVAPYRDSILGNHQIVGFMIEKEGSIDYTVAAR